LCLKAQYLCLLFVAVQYGSAIAVKEARLFWQAAKFLFSKMTFDVQTSYLATIISPVLSNKFLTFSHL
jgi:hypothetical protein